MKIFFWLPDTNGVGFYRGIAPACALADAGHQVAASERLPDAARDGAFDVIVGMRVSNLGPSRTWQELARAGHTKLVYEIDDDLWNVDPSNKAAFPFYQGEQLGRLTRNVEVSDVVTVTTAMLADQVSLRNPRVRVVPNQIPGWLLHHQRPTADMLTVGWRGGASHSRDFGELAAPLRRWLQHPAQRGRVAYHAMGVDNTDRVATRHGTVRHTPWNDSVSGFLRAVDFDAALIPLRPSQFNDSKSELALLEMSALGIPAIASPVGPYKEAAVNGAPVVLASTPAEWRDALDTLTHPETGEQVRAELSAAARAWVAGRTFEANVTNWIEAYQA